MSGASIHPRRAFQYILLIWILSLWVRMPQLNRPLAKHHEYNTAMVLMNIETWRTTGATQFHFIPVLNYPNAGDRIPARAAQPNFDEAGNALYFSFGAAWYIFPYAFYQLFQWPAMPLYLQILNLLLHGWGAWLWWRWWQAPYRKGQTHATAQLLSVAAYLFLPGMLWYNGNGYVNTSLSLPLLILWLMAAEKWSAHRNLKNYLCFVCMSLLCVYTDWFVVFLSFGYGWVDSKSRRHTLRGFASNAMAWLAPVALGMLLILAQYSSYVGLPDTLRALSNRFSERSVLEGSPSQTQLWLHFIQHYGSLYFPIWMWILIGGMRQARTILLKDSFFIGYGIALVLYHLVFFQWSAVHEFAMLADVLWLLYGLGVLASSSSPRRIRLFAIPFLLICVIQFYWINRPGSKARDGMAYHRYRDFGASLQALPKTAMLFMDRSWTAELQYHARRSIQPVADEQSAQKCMSDWKITEAYWIEHEGYQIRAIRPLRP